MNTSVKKWSNALKNKARKELLGIYNSYEPKKVKFISSRDKASIASANAMNAETLQSAPRPDKTTASLILPATGLIISFKAFLPFLIKLP